MHPESLSYDPDELLVHSHWVRSLARSLLADDALADDVVQETWAAALTGSPSQRGRIRAWLAAVVSNLAHGEQRARARRAARELAYAVSERLPSTADIVAHEAERRRVVDVVLRLHEPYRETLLLRFWCDLDPTTIAKRLGIPSSTVRNRLRRALAQVRSELERERPGETQRTLHILVALSAPSAAATTAAVAGGAAASVAGVLAMAVKLKILTAVAAVALAGAAGWALLPEEHHDTTTRDVEARQATASRDTMAEHPAEVAPPARQSLHSAAETGAPAARTTTQGTTRPAGAQVVLLGDVEDPDGHPIDGATVWLRNERNEERLATTQEGRGYVLARLTPGEWEIGCSAPQFRDAAQKIVLAQPQEQLDFTLEPAVLLGVRLVTPEGKPLMKELEKHDRDASFLLRDCLFPIVTKDPPGSTIPWVSPGEPFGVGRKLPEPGRYRPGCEWVLQCDAALPLNVSLVAHDMVLATQRVEAPATEVSLALAPSEVLSLATTVRLKVVDAGTGLPVKDLSLALGNGRSSSSGGYKPGADGVFVLSGLPFRMLNLWMHAKGYEQRFFPLSPVPGATIDLGTIELARSVTISGRVTSPAGGCDDAYLHLWPLDAMKPSVPLMTNIVFYSTSRDGDFEIDAGPGRYELIARPRNGEGMGATTVEVTSAGPVRDVQISVRSGVRVTIAPEFDGGTVLRILDAQGLPLWAELASRERRTVSLSAGRYTLEARTEDGVLKAIPFEVGNQPLSLPIAP